MKETDYEPEIHPITKLVNEYRGIARQVLQSAESTDRTVKRKDLLLGQTASNSATNMNDDDAPPIATRERQISQILPRTHIPHGFDLSRDFDQTFSGVRVSRAGLSLRVGAREYSIEGRELGSEVVASSNPSHLEPMNNLLPISSFIDQKINFLNTKRGREFYEPIHSAIDGVHVHSTPGQFLIDRYIFAVSNGIAIRGYKQGEKTIPFQENPVDDSGDTCIAHDLHDRMDVPPIAHVRHDRIGAPVEIPAPAFFDMVIGKIANLNRRLQEQHKEKQYEARLRYLAERRRREATYLDRQDKAKEAAAKAGVSSSGSTYEIFERIKSKQNEDRARQEAVKYGLSSCGSASEIWDRVNNRKEHLEQSQRITLEQRTAQRFHLDPNACGNMSVSEMRNMHLRANQQAENDQIILQAIHRKPDQRVSYPDRLAERHAYSNAGVYDASLSRHSDELLVEYAQNRNTRSVEEVNREVLQRAKKRNPNPG